MLFFPLVSRLRLSICQSISLQANACPSATTCNYCIPLHHSMPTHNQIPQHDPIYLLLIKCNLHLTRQVSIQQPFGYWLNALTTRLPATALLNITSYNQIPLNYPMPSSHKYHSVSIDKVFMSL